MKKLALLLFGIFLLQGCCVGGSETRIYLKPEEKACVPYQKDQIIEFTDNNNVTHTFKVTLDYSYLEQTSYSSKFNCNQDITSTEIRQTKLEDTNHNMTFILELTPQGGGNFWYDKNLTIKMNNSLTAQVPVYYPASIDTISFNGKLYKEVYSVDFYTNQGYAAKLYYNKEFGIIYFEDEQGKKYTLK